MGTYATSAGAGAIAARLDRLPATRAVWTRVILLSLGGFFEFYDMFFTGYIGPGLVRSHILTPTTSGLFGATGLASFVAAMFSGLFLGTMAFSFLADRLGRRAIFTYSLLWYSAATVIMAFQNDAFGLNLWRFIVGIGVGVELVTIDAYLSEMVPAALRGRAFACNNVIQFSSVTVVAFLSWLLVPRAPFGLDGWRWVMLVAAIGAICVWWIRRRVPESPRWLARHGRILEAERIMDRMEAEAIADGGVLPPMPDLPEQESTRGNFLEIWKGPYLRRTVMLTIFNLFQTVGYYGFNNWVPTLLIKQGITLTNSLMYTFLIAIAAPFGPLVALIFADKVERKWQIVAAAAGVAIAGTLFGQTTFAPLLIFLGILLTLSNNAMSFAFHTYQAELYPTRVRALAIGFVYSWSRLSVVFSAFVIAFVLERFGVAGVFAFISGAMAIVMIAIGAMGPKTRGLALELISG
ncbi:MAG TPA: MFS transporter [Bryobacteraceae bacterium]|nr:MFS transporter [Bryobacteraceae bacterium]